VIALKVGSDNMHTWVTVVVLCGCSELPPLAPGMAGVQAHHRIPALDCGAQLPTGGWPTVGRPCHSGLGKADDGHVVQEERLFFRVKISR